MKPNLLDNNNLIKKKWLKFNFNSNICRFLKDLNHYPIDDLIEYNENQSFFKSTALPSVLKNMVVYETLYGLIVEYKDAIRYMVYYYSFNFVDFMKIENLLYLQKV